MKIGFIGLGAMGLPMAKRVLAGGYELLTLVHTRREPAAELASMGAQIRATPAEIAREADGVITIVPADAELRETVFGEQGLARGFSAGKTLIDMTTCTALTMHNVEEQLTPMGVGVLDAPVSGGPPAAEAGTLTIMAAGSSALLERWQPVLETMGAKIVHVGGVGQGKVVKMINQLIAAVNLLAMGEGFALGVRCGADPEVLRSVIQSSSGYSRMMDLRLPGFLLEGNFQPGFRLDLMKKDINLAIDSARAAGIPLLLGSTVAQVFAAASAAGLGSQDFAAAAQFLAGLGGVNLAKA
jgi:3-hydroxyisobutyrate dehydrogenase-like beta-hydroxyacid dehydrogenase